MEKVEKNLRPIQEMKITEEKVVKAKEFVTKENNAVVENNDIVVNVINASGNVLPTYATPASAGLDLRACLTENVIVPAHGGVRLIPTGLKMAIPEGYECQIRPRSGLAVKNGVTVLNTPGTVDADFRGEVCVILINHSATDFVVKPGERIAQAVFNKFTRIAWNEVDELDTTERGEGGFGHTGKQ